MGFSRRARRILGSTLAFAAAHAVVFGQNPPPGAGDWMTAAADAQRTSWVRTDPFISAASISRGEFGLRSVVRIPEARALSSGVTNGALQRMPLSLVAGDNDRVFAFDHDSGIVLWERQLVHPDGLAATNACGLRMPTAPARATPLVPPTYFAIPALGISTSKGPYVGGVGEPGGGAPDELMKPGRSIPQGGNQIRTALQRAAAEALARETGATSSPQPAAASTAGRGGGGGQPTPAVTAYVLSQRGVLHTIGFRAGKDVQRPVPLLPESSRISAIAAVGGALYVVATDCATGSSELWSVDPSDQAASSNRWVAEGRLISGGPAFSGDGRIILTLRASPPGSVGPGATPYSVVALDPKTLSVRDWATREGADISAAPTIFPFNDKEIVATVASDGRIFLFDAAALGGADHKTPLREVSAIATRGGYVPAGVATWKAADGTRWLLVPFSGRLSVGSSAVEARNQDGGVAAYRLVDRQGAPALELAWVSRDLVAPWVPVVINGVVFAISTGVLGSAGGAGSPQVSGGQPAVLYAFEAASGKELWNSGVDIRAPAQSGAIWSAGGYVFVPASDGSVYTFGFPVGVPPDISN